MDQKGNQKWMVVVTVLLGTFTIILNNSMLNPIIPYFMEVFQADAVSASWIITIFMVSMGITMPLTGFLSDKWGKKRMYMIGLALFIVGSLLGSFSWNLGALITFRAIQGVAGGIMLPLSMALIFEVFPKNERGSATGIYGVSAMVAPAIGPTLGGVITEFSNWHFLFLFNIPVGIAGLIFASKYLKSTTKQKDLKLDKFGFITVTIGIGSILYALGRISEVAHVYNPLNLALVIAGLISLTVFTKYELKTDAPLLNLTIFKISTYTASVFISAITSVGLFGGIFLIPLLVQNVLEMSVVVTGLVLLPAALAMGVFMSIGGRLLDRNGPKGVVTVGLTIAAATNIFLGFFTIETSLWVLVLILVVRGMGLGLSNIPATTAGMNAIQDHMVAHGAAMNNVLRQISSALGIVFISIYYEVRKAHIELEGIMAQDAALQAINEGFIIIGVLTILIIPAGWKLSQSDDEKDTGEPTAAVK